MKVLSLYCGAGGIDEGLKQAGLKTSLAIDCERDCIETMKLNHECETIISKIEDVESSIDNFDVIVGGPPCPEFSRAKTSRTLDPTEVNRFWAIIEKIKPKYFLMENVQDVVKVCNRKNYLINCADYGVPQTRLRRIFTNLPLPRQTYAKTICYTLAGDIIKKWLSVKDVLGLDGIIEDRKTVFGENNYRQYDTDKPSNTIVSDARQWYVAPTGFSAKNKKEISRKIESPIMTIVNANEYVLTNHRVMSQKYIQYRKEANTSKLYEHKLTNKELSLLQGFPDTYRFFGNKSSVRKQIGNAVPPQPIKAFFEQILLTNKAMSNP